MKEAETAYLTKSQLEFDRKPSMDFNIIKEPMETLNPNEFFELARE